MTDTLEQRLKARAALEKDILSKIKKWPARLEKLKTRKEHSMLEAAFCRKYGLNTGRFNRLKNGRDHSLPSKKLLNKIEDAFKAEGV